MGKRQKRENAAKPEDAVAMSRANSDTPPEAEKEVMDCLFAQMSGKTEEI